MHLLSDVGHNDNAVYKPRLYIGLYCKLYFMLLQMVSLVMIVTRTTLVHRTTLLRETSITHTMRRPSLCSVMSGVDASSCHVHQAQNGTRIFSLVTGQNNPVNNEHD